MASSVTWAVTPANHCQLEVNIKRKLMVRRGRSFFYSEPRLKKEVFSTRHTVNVARFECVVRNSRESPKFGPAFIRLNRQ